MSTDSNELKFVNSLAARTLSGKLKWKHDDTKSENVWIASAPNHDLYTALELRKPASDPKPEARVLMAQMDTGGTTMEVVIQGKIPSDLIMDALVNLVSVIDNK
jgi:hypothetical protein